MMIRPFTKILKYKKYDANQSNFWREKCDKKDYECEKLSCWI
jgi:hypothetical protein